MTQKIELGDYILFIGEILETHVDKDKFNEENSKIDIKKIDPLVYCAVVREYWSIGEKLGDAFSVGKELKK